MRRAKLQNSWTKGVLDPRLRDRVDLAHYFNSARTGDNVEVRPQGGFRRRAGTAHHVSRLRNRLDPIHLDADMVTTHNGGTPANLFDENTATLFTTDAINTDQFVILEVDLGLSVAVAAVDITDFKTATTKINGGLALEYYDGTDWATAPGADDPAVSQRRDIRSTERTRRFSRRPGTALATARHWRFVVYSGSGAGAFSLRRLRFWVETEFSVETELFEFSKSQQETYQLIVTPRNIDVFDHGDFLASIAAPISHQQIDAIDWAQTLDTAFIFHETLETPQITRQGAGDEWNIAPANFSNVPDLTQSIVTTGSQDEVQDITFPALTAGNVLRFFLGDDMTGEIVYVDEATLAADLAGALNALPAVPGGVGVAVEAVSPLVLRVSFGDAAGDRAWPLIEAQVIGVDGWPTTDVVQPGTQFDGPLMSAETGWPRTGAIVQSRLIVGGFRSASGTFLATRAGFGSGAFDFTITGNPVTADLGIQHTLDSDEVEVIQRIFLGRHLQIFTASSEWWIENRSLDATQPLNVILATRHGIANNVPLVFADNATLFLQSKDVDADAVGFDDDTGQILRDFIYGDIEQNYTADPLSLLGPHLLGRVVSLAHRRARSVNRGNRIVLINDDGTMAILTLLRAQEVIAITGPMTTEGDWRRIMFDTNGRGWVIAERFGSQRLEEMRDDLLFDASVFYSGVATTTISGLPYPDGTVVWAIADRDLVGPYVVAGAAVELEVAASVVTVGLPFFVDAETNPVRDRVNESQPYRPPGRIYEIELSLMNTGEIRVGVNDQPPSDLPLHFLDGEVPLDQRSGEEVDTERRDLPFLDRLISGYRVREGIQGFSEHPRIRITQSVPGPLEVRSIRYELSHKGG